MRVIGNDIAINQWDYGVPVIFEVEPESQGTSLIGDELRLTFEGDIIPHRKNLIASDEDYTLSFALTEAEANNIFSGSLKGTLKIPYSLKRYKDEQYLDTILDANLLIERTVKWTESE